MIVKRYNHMLREYYERHGKISLLYYLIREYNEDIESIVKVISFNVDSENQTLFKSEIGEIIKSKSYKSWSKKHRSFSCIELSNELLKERLTTEVINRLGIEYNTKSSVSNPLPSSKISGIEIDPKGNMSIPDLLRISGQAEYSKEKAKDNAKYSTIPVMDK